MTRISLGAFGLALVIGLAASPRGAAAQDQSDDAIVGRLMASRADLEGVVSRLEQTGTNTTLLGRARARLTEGDFRPGDKIVVTVQGDTALSDTFAVWQSRDLRLPSPAVGSLSLVGVLRSEIQEKVQTFVARFVRNPTVLAQPLMRLSFQGDFARAGIYAVPADAPLADAFMAAGGTTNNANMDKIKVQRNGRELMNARAVNNAIASGMTVDQLGLRDGDQLVVPKSGGNIMGGVRTVALLVSLGVGVTTLATRL